MGGGWGGNVRGTWEGKKGGERGKGGRWGREDGVRWVGDGGGGEESRAEQEGDLDKKRATTRGGLDRWENFRQEVST